MTDTIKIHAPKYDDMHAKVQALADRLSLTPLTRDQLADGQTRYVFAVAGGSRYDLLDLVHAVLDRIDSPAKEPAS